MLYKAVGLEALEADPAGNGSRDQILAGIRIVDLGQALAGPFASTMLSDFGADVLKIERREGGDPMRRLGPRRDGIPLWWKSAGRNKRSVTLDFTTPRGRELLLDLVRRSDVVVENFRPGTLERHGLGWDALREVNPKLVMLRISGFGQTGPYNVRLVIGRTREASGGGVNLYRLRIDSAGNALGGSGGMPSGHASGSPGNGGAIGAGAAITGLAK